jgi:dynein heavy chain
LRPTGKETDDDSWGAIKSLLADSKALKEALAQYAMKRIQYCTQKQVNKVKDKVDANQSEFGRLQEISPAALGMYKWVSATVNYFEVHKKVKPMQDKVEQMRRKAVALRQELLETEELLMKLNKELEELTENRDRKQTILDRLKQEAEKMAKRLKAAETLISGLGSEQVRWGKDKDDLAEKKEKLVGDCIVSSSFLSYAGPFDFTFRKKMIYEHWLIDCQQKSLPLSENFRIESLLTTDVEISQWASQGLPTDELSVQNGILTTRASRWPLCIDPQLQAVSWIKNKEKDLKVSSFNDPNFLKYLIGAIKYSKPFLFENVDNELDPIIDPILEKNVVVKAGQKFIKIAEEDCEYNEKDFRLFLTSKLANPNYTPEIMSKTMVINYSVTMTGLRDQLLNVVVGFERPDKEEQRKQLIISQSENRKTLKELEDLLLKGLAE